MNSHINNNRQRRSREWVDSIGPANNFWWNHWNSEHFSGSAREIIAAHFEYRKIVVIGEQVILHDNAISGLANDKILNRGEFKADKSIIFDNNTEYQSKW